MKKNEKTFPTPDSCASTVRESSSIVGISFADSIAGPAETLVMVPINGPRRVRLYRLSDLHKTAGLADDAEKLRFNDDYLSDDSASGPILLWQKLRRHDPALFRLLLFALRPRAM